MAAHWSRLLILCVAGTAMGQSGGSTNPLSLCSSQNTASDPSQYQFSIYNSYGSCTQHCAGFAYAILQGKYCWCSNESPGSDTSVSSCSETCPGFDTDHCGNSNEGLYGYAQIGQPSGTQSASSRSSSTSVASTSSSSSVAATSSTAESSTTSSTTSAGTSTSSAATSSSSSATSTTSSTSASSPTSTMSSTSSSTSSSPTSSSSSASSTSVSSTSISSTSTSDSSTSSSSLSTSSTSSTSTDSSRTTSPDTASSSPSTSSPATASSSAASETTPQTTPSASLPPNSSKSSDNGYWQNGGAVAGTFVGVGIGVLLIVALILFLCCRRRRRRSEGSPHEKHGDMRGLGITGRGSPKTPPNRVGSGSHAFSPFAHSNSPTSPRHMRSSSSAFSNDMNLVPIFDQRVDPNQFYMRWEQNGSRASLQDNEDYSRKVLRVANPDNASY